MPTSSPHAEQSLCRQEDSKGGDGLVIAPNNGEIN